MISPRLICGIVFRRCPAQLPPGLQNIRLMAFRLIMRLWHTIIIRLVTLVTMFTPRATTSMDVLNLLCVR